MDINIERFIREYGFYLVGVAVLAVAVTLFLILVAHAEPRHHRDRDEWRDLDTPSVACPDQQTLDEVEALRRLGDREGEAITRRQPAFFPTPVAIQAIQNRA